MNELLRRLASLFRRRRFERELEEEMRFHLEMKSQELGDACRARRAFGNPTLLREESREAWGWRWLDTLVQDLRFALRMMRRNHAVTAVAVLTLAAGIGANTAVFSLLEAVVLRPLPYHQPERLFMLWTRDAQAQRSMNSSYPDFRDWREQSQAFQGLAAYRGGSFNLTGKPEPDHVAALHVTANLLGVLGIQPVLGRTWSEDEREPVVLLTHRLWLRRFGGDPGVVGRTIHLDGGSYPVLGVLPRGFHFPPRRFAAEPELFVPLVPYADRTNWSLGVIGRLQPGVTEQQARAEMDTIAARLARTYPPVRGRQGITLDPAHRYVVGDANETALVLLGAVGFVLLIACVNVANLLLSQGAGRAREIAIRIALGANRGRLVRQLLTESVLLGSAGGLLGLLIAHWALPLLAAAAPERTVFLTRLQDTGIQLNTIVLGFTAALSVLTGLLFGVLPAWKCLRPVGSSARGVRGGPLRGILVALEVALAFVLLAGAGLMMKSFLRLTDTDPGFRTEKLLTMYAGLPRSKYAEPDDRAAFFREALHRLEGLPGALSVGAIVDLPLSRSWSVNSVQVEGPPPRPGRAAFHAVSPGYFATMGIPLLRGRPFTDADSGAAPGVAIVNRTMALKYWPDDDPVGKAVLATRGIRERTAEGTRLRFVKERLEVVGLVGDVRHLGLDAEPLPELFMPYPQRPPGEMTLILRTAVDPGSLIPAARKEIWRVDPDQPVTDVKTMDQWLSADVAPRRFVLLLIGVFAVAAAVLAAVGIYGVISYAVAQRTQEIGIRMALGAQWRSVVSLVLRQNAVWLAVGLAAGTVGAAGLTGLLRNHLYAVRPTDPATFCAVALLLAAVALAASAVPARRAARVDPVEALRHE